MKKYWPVFLVIIVFLLRLPSLFEPFLYGDEGIYLTLGQATRKGLIIYRDIHDNKPPLLYWLAALAGNITYFKLLLSLSVAATIYVFHKLARQPVLTIIFAILISIPTFEGNIANAENFMMLPTILGFYLFLKANKYRDYFLIGILFALAGLFKIPAVFDFAALLFLILIKPNKLKTVPCILYTVIGFVLPFMTTFIYFFTHHALPQYFKTAFLENIFYLSSWSPNQIKILGFSLSFIIRAGLLALIMLLIFIFRNKLSQKIKLIIIWFSFALFAALLSSRPYPHYLLQLLPPLVLSFGLIKSKYKSLPIGMLLISLFAFLFFRFWYYRNLPYYLNFYRFALRQESKEIYLQKYNPDALYLYQTAAYLQRHTNENDRLFLWGNYSSLYPLTNRLPANRLTVAYHIVDFDGYAEAVETLKKDPPKYIVVEKQEKHPFLSFFFFLQNNYFLLLENPVFKIYLRQ